MLTRIKRFFRLMKVRKLEIEFDSLTELLFLEPRNDSAMIVRYRSMVREKLAKARADYAATFEPGDRFTWRNG